MNNECPPPGVGVEEAPMLPQTPSVYFAAEKDAWFSSIPDKLTLEIAIERLESVTNFAKAIIRKIVFAHSGTVPPPPWPSPELHEAIKRAEGLKDGLQVFAKRKVALSDEGWKKVRIALLREGGNTWDKTSELEARWQYLLQRSPMEAARDAASFALDKGKEALFGKWAPLWWIGGTIAVGYAFYAFSDVLKSASRLKGSTT